MTHDALSMITPNHSGRIAGLGVAAVALLCLGATESLADRDGGGPACRTRYDVRTIQYTVNDHSSTDNTPAGDLVLKKECNGPVIATFSAQLSGNLHLHELWADCVNNGGFATGCTAGQRIVASPPHTLLQSNGAPEVSYPVETVSWVWDAVPPGTWRFRVQPAAFAPVTVYYSLFTVEALGNVGR